MKPEQFIREKGLKKAREVVEGAPEGATHYGLRQYRQWEGRILKTFTDESWRSTAVFGGNLRFIEDDCLCIQDLKRLLESIDQINAFDGGIKEAKEILSRINKNGSKYATLFERPALEQAIRDHESIYGGGENA
ncbi:hypothetical protein K5D25_04445 [Acinetobacter baumannii]|uniref:hypothetical protein n=1 Tax=Acinetobacter baumannii TaxID=470 RepID=UPI001FF2FADD|nr:hypothetical protein [Acinetobacter baumannii]MCJ8813053.1 hypothetical protein [Acinetobacter baumannii]MCJ8835507.1 hypothetical protein [Acinetobacter baumannii]